MCKFTNQQKSKWDEKEVKPEGKGELMLMKNCPRDNTLKPIVALITRLLHSIVAGYIMRLYFPATLIRFGSNLSSQWSVRTNDVSFSMSPVTEDIACSLVPRHGRTTHIIRVVAPE